MRCARPPPRRTTRATIRFGSSLSPAVTSLAAALLTALVAEPASRPAGKQQPSSTSKSLRLTAGGSFSVTPKTAADGPKHAQKPYKTRAGPVTVTMVLLQPRLFEGDSPGVLEVQRLH